MTCHASFVPILLTSTQPNPMCRRKRLVEPIKKKNLVRRNKTRKKKESHTYGPNDAQHIVWACFTHCSPIQPNPSS